MKIRTGRIALLAGAAWLALGGAGAAKPCRQQVGDLQNQLSKLGLASSSQRNEMVAHALQHADSEPDRCERIVDELEYLLAMLEPGPRPRSAPAPAPEQLLAHASPAAPANAGQQSREPESTRAEQPAAGPDSTGGKVRPAPQQQTSAGQQGESEARTTGPQAPAGSAAQARPQEQKPASPAGGEGATPQDQKPSGSAAKASAAKPRPGPQKPAQGPEQARACPPTVKVKRGDTLIGIAQRCEVTLKALLSANPGLDDPRLIRIGQKIQVPAGK
jgi:LysM repeat protein